MSRLRVVVGGQYGSEAKGACTAQLARQAARDGLTVVIRVAGPNAGHTAYDDQGRKWALRQIPVAAVVDNDIELVIGAGSEIDFEVLVDEVRRLEEGGIPIRRRLVVDDQATMITSEHKVKEISGAHLIEKIGSTGKGIGAARADRLMRGAYLVRDVLPDFAEEGIAVESGTSHVLYHQLQMPEATVIIEGTQGYGLGLHAGTYPQCTSSDCRAIDFLGMAGIDPFWTDDYKAWVVLRTYPIRVAGNSGPLAGETTWEELGFEPERTTVTQKIRRVGQWDAGLARTAVVANGGRRNVLISLSMVDYVIPELAGRTDLKDIDPTVLFELNALIEQVQSDAGAEVALLGTGPETFISMGDL